VPEKAMVVLRRGKKKIGRPRESHYNHREARSHRGKKRPSDCRRTRGKKSSVTQGVGSGCPALSNGNKGKKEVLERRHKHQGKIDWVPEGVPKRARGQGRQSREWGKMARSEQR